MTREFVPVLSKSLKEGDFGPAGWSKADREHVWQENLMKMKKLSQMKMNLVLTNRSHASHKRFRFSAFSSSWQARLCHPVLLAVVSKHIPIMKDSQCQDWSCWRTAAAVSFPLPDNNAGTPRSFVSLSTVDVTRTGKRSIKDALPVTPGINLPSQCTTDVVAGLADLNRADLNQWFKSRFKSNDFFVKKIMWFKSWFKKLKNSKRKQVTLNSFIN